MTEQNCSVIQSSFSEYLDGAVSGQQMQSIAKHLESCEDCSSEFAALQSLQRSLAMLGPAKPSPESGPQTPRGYLA